MDAIANLDPKFLRGLLAEQRVTHSEYARRCRLSRVYISRILTGAARPGELATIKLLRGLEALGLDRQAADV
jgi:transcriptional regulator with XRE-family HTH domain